MTFLAPFFFLILGLIVGSFLNVVIYRFNTSKVLKGRSACISCYNRLHWYELIPLISFLVLKGRCRTCQTKISRVYLLVESLTGFIFLGLFLKFQNLFLTNLSIFIITFSYYAIAFSILLVISFYDLKHKIIPDKLALTLGIWSFVGLFLFNEHGLSVHIPAIFQFFSGIFIAIPFAFLWFISQGTWMGLGDAKLVLGLGWLVGLVRAISGVVISFWVGALFGIFLILFSKKYKMSSEIPFAPFLIFSTIFVFLFELYVFPIF